MNKAYAEELRNKRILVVGAGRSGKAAVTELHAIGADVSLQDSGSIEKIDREFIDFLKSNGIRHWLGCEPAEEDGSFDMVVVSPGVPPTIPMIRKACDGGAELVGELELAYRLSEGRFVAITGTNGKTTTTTLTGEIFKAAGRKTAVVGNIGVAVMTEALRSTEDEWFITEASSFQLETTSRFRPVISAILNLTPDHLNRHGTMEAYAAAKARVFANQTQDDFLIINYDDEPTRELTADCQATVIPFSRKSKLERGAYLDGTGLFIRDGADRRPELICDRSELQIIGDHNVENVLAAAAICYYAGIPADVISEAVRAFPGVEHRIEYCGTVDGVKYYNDSKGTNVDAAIIALKALEKDIILIAGGDGKAQDFTDFGKGMPGRVKHLILFGRDAGDIGKAAEAAGFTDIHYASDLEECVRLARDLAVSGDKVLLSPACASWDMYKSYEHRGRHFKNCVANLK